MAPGDLGQGEYLALSVQDLEEWERSNRRRARRETHQRAWSAQHNRLIGCRVCGTAQPANVPSYCPGDLVVEWAQRQGFSGTSEERYNCYRLARRVYDVWGIRPELPRCLYSKLKAHFGARPAGSPRTAAYVPRACLCRCYNCRQYHGDPAIWPNPPGAVADAAAAAAAPAPAPAPAPPASSSESDGDSDDSDVVYLGTRSS